MVEAQKIDIQEIKEIIQSANLNFLMGAGLSTPFLPLLNDIEKRLTAEENEEKRILIYREYFQKVMVPNTRIIEGRIESDTFGFSKTIENYKNFFNLITRILLSRKSTILSKQANVFTTNIDILMETALEDINLEYNDGFSGQLNPTFSLSNFKRSICKRSLHFENISEIPVFNLVKIHGSLTWKKIGEEIYYSKLEYLSKLAPPVIFENEDINFMEEYKKIAIVNPEPEKLRKTVIDLIYYELLRMYSSELEKENTVLFVMGFSMADEHIRKITIRAAESNPTLKIYIFCYEKMDVVSMQNNMSIGKLKYSNIEIISPIDDNFENRYSFERINETVFREVLKKPEQFSNTHEKK